jgi:hypothetical protein
MIGASSRADAGSLATFPEARFCRTVQLLLRCLLLTAAPHLAGQGSAVKTAGSRFAIGAGSGCRASGVLRQGGACQTK